MTNVRILAALAASALLVGGTAAVAATLPAREFVPSDTSWGSDPVGSATPTAAAPTVATPTVRTATILPAAGLAPTRTSAAATAAHPQSSPHRDRVGGPGAYRHHGLTAAPLATGPSDHGTGGGDD